MATMSRECDCGSNLDAIDSNARMKSGSLVFPVELLYQVRYPEVKLCIEDM